MNNETDQLADQLSRQAHQLVGGLQEDALWNRPLPSHEELQQRQTSRRRSHRRRTGLLAVLLLAGAVGLSYRPQSTETPSNHSIDEVSTTISKLDLSPAKDTTEMVNLNGLPDESMDLIATWQTYEPVIVFDSSGTSVEGSGWLRTIHQQPMEWAKLPQDGQRAVINAMQGRDQPVKYFEL